ncbi:hypothetical protein GRF59_19305 [Paenibacillus sp. HJL G12]|uniref:Uncharacterized protein n=1 Tax=Paenibacillus dendrobii TaxID=2691084 RepID=A0A7X3IPB5_9BACL|nr:hypothetical protein [Paenibacillus dendrobii]MWV45767.1 hypothetical protein [Paenibacillus dendrobii]
MSLGKAAAWILEAMRSIVFLLLGLMALGAVQRPLLRGGQLTLIEMLLVSTADLAILYVVHRKLLAQRRFYRASQKPVLTAGKTLILLGYAGAALLIAAL